MRETTQITTVIYVGTSRYVALSFTNTPTCWLVWDKQRVLVANTKHPRPAADLSKTSFQKTNIWVLKLLKVRAISSKTIKWKMAFCSRCNVPLSPCRVPSSHANESVQLPEVDFVLKVAIVASILLARLYTIHEWSESLFKWSRRASFSPIPVFEVLERDAFKVLSVFQPPSEQPPAQNWIYDPLRSSWRWLVQIHQSDGAVTLH